MGEIFGIPGARGSYVGFAFGSEDFHDVVGVFGELELASVMDHLGTDAAVDKAFNREPPHRDHLSRRLDGELHLRHSRSPYLWAGGPAFELPTRSITVGAPSLRCWQGRV